MDITANIAHTATNLHGVGNDISLLCRVVVERYKLFVSARIEVEVAEAEPHRATHTLIYQELTVSTRSVHRVVGIRNRALLGAVAHIEAILARYGNLATPHHLT